MVEIVESTPRRLVLRKSGRTVRAFILGGIGLVLLVCMMVYLEVRTTSMRCARGPAGLTCDATDKLLGFIPLASQRIEHVERAVVGTTGDSSDPSYRVELATGDFHDTPLSSRTVNRWQCEFFVGSFNDFVRSGKSADDFVQLPDWIPMVLLLPLSAAALGCFMLAQPYRFEIDRDRGCLTIRGGIKNRASHPLADVDDVRVDERQHEGETVCEVFLLLKGGTRLRLEIEPGQVDLVGDYFQRPVGTHEG